MEIKVHVLSDSIGETGELLTKSVLSQFGLGLNEIKRYSHINEKKQVKEIFSNMEGNKNLVIFTVVERELRNYIILKGEEFNVETVDLMTPSINAVYEIIGREPSRESGVLRKLDKDYFKKMAAIDFTVKHDDGKNPIGIKQADIVIIGISRTSKTPLSMYLSYQNFKVANIPLVPEVEPPKELFEKDKRRIVGLVSDPKKINQIRQERLKALGLEVEAKYANLDRINTELQYSKRLMKELDCKIIDVSNKAVEETAGIIADYMVDIFGV